MHSLRNPLWRITISWLDDQLESMEPVSKERKGAKSVAAEFTDYWRQPK